MNIIHITQFYSYSYSFNTSIESIGEHRDKEIDKYIKFLGFKKDDDLFFKYHIKEIINKTAKGTYALELLNTHYLKKLS